MSGWYGLPCISLTMTPLTRRFRKSARLSAPLLSISLPVAVCTGAGTSSRGSSTPGSGVVPTTVTVTSSVGGAGGGGCCGSCAGAASGCALVCACDVSTCSSTSSNSGSTQRDTKTRPRRRYSVGARKSMKRISVFERVLGTIGLALIGVICVATDRLPKGAASLVIGAIRLFGWLVDHLSVHLIYKPKSHPAQPSDSAVRRIRHV